MGDLFHLLLSSPAIIEGTYNLYLVALSYLVAVLAAYIAFEIARLLRKRAGNKLSFGLLFGGSFAMGAGIFAMHFIGFQAHILPVPVTYDLMITFFSLVIAIIGSGCALFVIQKPRLGLRETSFAGIFFGIAIAGMHYMGMAAINGIQVEYKPFYVLLSIAIAIGASFTALWIMLHDKGGESLNLFKGISALVMGIAIVGMHYTAMEAAILTVSSSSSATAGHWSLSPETISLIVALILSSIMVVILVSIGYRHRIAVKLFVASTSKLIIILPIGILILSNSLANRERINTIVHKYFPIMHALLEIERLTDAMQIEIEKTFPTTEEEASALETSIIIKKEKIDKWIHRYILNLPKNEDGEERTEEIASLFQNYRHALRPLSKIKNKDQWQLAVEKAKNEKIKLRFFLKKELIRVKEDTHYLYKKYLSSSQDVRSLARFLIIFFLFFSFLIAFFLSRQISGPIIKIRNASKEVAKGDLKQHIVLYNVDEIGQLAASFNQMVENLSKSQNNLELLSELGNLLPTCVSEEEVYLIFSEYTAKLLPGYSGMLAVFISSHGYLEVKSAWGELLSFKETKFLPKDCLALRQGQPFTADGERFNIKCRHLKGLTSNYTCFPFLVGGEFLGVLTIAFEKKLFSKEEEKILSRISGDVALAISNIRLRETLKEMSIHDPLTNLYNRRFMEEAFSKEISKASRKEMPLSILMLDLDRFKAVNDTYGHVAGDSILKEFGFFLKECFRESDIICRYGGEEFVVILPETDAESAIRRAEIMRKKVSSFIFGTGRESASRLTISIGIAVFPDHGKTASELLRAADFALYQAKQAGKDRVVVYAS